MQFNAPSIGNQMTQKNSKIAELVNEIMIYITRLLSVSGDIKTHNIPFFSTICFFPSAFQTSVQKRLNVASDY
jgi:hypothetical protein